MRRALFAFIGLLLALVLVARVVSAQPQSLPGGIDDVPAARPPSAPPAPAPDGGAPEGDADAPAPAVPHTPNEAPDAGAPTGLTRFDLQGYVNVGVGMTARPRALPRDRLTYGLRSSVAGLIVRGHPFEHFSYTVHFGVNPDAVRVVTGVDIVDTSGTGSSTKAATRTRPITFLPVEEVSIAYAPVDWIEIKGGHFYMPFSPGASVLITSQMFPTRPGPTQVFMTGADQGLMASATLLDRRIIVAVGAFNGSSLELNVPQTTPLGPTYDVFLDVHPLGKMPRVEGDPTRGPFRFALGGGMIYRTGALFDATGYESTKFREVRVDGALRVAFLGFFLQAEVLRRLQTDDLSARPQAATGAYAQASYFQPLTERLALAPLVRAGIARQDEGFAPREIKQIEAGLAFYPRRDQPEPNRLRFILQYSGELRDPEAEVAHGVVLHSQLRW